MSDAQRQSLNALHERALRATPGGVNSPVRSVAAVDDRPLFITRASGSRVFDENHHEMIDLIGSWGAMIAGHAHPKVIEAVKQVTDNGLGFGATTQLEIELAEQVIARVPGIEQVRLVTSGTEACMSAVRLARAATGRDAIVKFEGCYHGHSDALLAGAGSGLATFGIPSTPGVTEGATRDTITLPYNDENTVHELFNQRGSQIAAVIVEPVAGNMGVVPARPEFLTTLRNLTRQHGAILIFDEVMSGFRVAPGGAQQLYNITPDLTTLGKIVGGGLPTAAYGGRRELMQHIAPAGNVYQAGTLAGNPLAVAAGLATLRLLDDAAYAHLDDITQQLENALRDCFKQHHLRACVQRAGAMLGVFFDADTVANYTEACRANHDMYAALFRALRTKGVLIPPSGYESWFVSLAHTKEDVDAIVDAVRASINELNAYASDEMYV